ETFQYNKPLQSTHATFECVLTEDFSSYQDVVEKCNQYPNQSFEVVLRIKNKHDDVRANFWRFIRRDEGNHNFILGIGFDDTNAQEKIYALEAIKNNPNGLVIATDRKGVVNFASRGFEELLKLPLDQILGKHFSHFLFKEDAQYGEHIFSEIFKNGKT
ncbi:PAS domain-containing protein, partial [Bacillus pumilus]|uniref:PAS domain-containing protein n=1 Tax=Bacillus pumilus TaxID=1408 RepID=UPI003314E0B0